MNSGHIATQIFSCLLGSHPDYSGLTNLLIRQVGNRDSLTPDGTRRNNGISLDNSI